MSKAQRIASVAAVTVAMAALLVMVVWYGQWSQFIPIRPGYYGVDRWTWANLGVVIGRVALEWAAIIAVVAVAGLVICFLGRRKPK